MRKNTESSTRSSQINKGFTLIELLVVISIIGLLSGAGIVALNSARAKSRDARRAADMKQIANALQLYYNAHGAYPPVNPAAQGVGGWEVSYNNGFLANLSEFITNPKDPTNKLEQGFSFFGAKAGSYFYAYYNYPASSAAYYGCTFNSPFSVIAVRQLELGAKPETPKATCGAIPPGGCPGGGIPNTCRDWSTEYDYSVMLVQ